MKWRKNSEEKQINRKGNAMAAKKDSILKATLVVSILVIICKLLGFAREAIIAAYYGANAETDAFFFAQGMPASIFPSICNSISTAFTALYVKKKMDDKLTNGVRYASSMLGVTSIIGIGLSLLGAFLAQWLVPIFAPGFKGEQLTLAIHLTRMIMGAFFLTMLQYMLGAILNSNKLFYAAQVANISNNIIVIAITILVGKDHNIDILTISVIVGLAINVFILMVCCRTYISFKRQPADGSVNLIRLETKELINLSLPIILGNSVIQVNTIVDKALGSLLEEGSLSALTYAGTINAMITGIFIMSLSTVLYPTLAEEAAMGDMKEFGKKTTNSLGMLSILLTFLSFFVFLDSKQIISIIFQRGSFDEQAAKITGIVLAAYSFLYVFSGIREVLTRALFAIKDTKTPMINSAVGVCFNILFSIILVKVIGIAGIAIGTVLSNIIISALLVRSTRGKIPEMDLQPFVISVLKQIIAGIVMFVVVYCINILLPYLNAYLSFLIDVVTGFLVYCIILYLLRCKEFKDALHMVIRRVKRY